MTTDLGGLARKFGATADVVSGATLKRALREGGFAGKRAANKVASQVAGSDRAITMGGRRKVILGSGFDVEPTSVAINLRPPGAWVLFDKGAKPHDIPKRRRKRNPKVMRIDRLSRDGRDGPLLTTIAHHPGRHGVRAIRRAFAKAEDEATEAIAKQMIEEVRRAWR